MPWEIQHTPLGEPGVMNTQLRNTLALQSAENILFCTQLCHKLWFSGGNKVPCTQQIKRECPQARCVAFSIRDSSKQVAFTKEVRWAELYYTNIWGLDCLGFVGVRVVLLHRNQSYYSKLLVKYRVITSQIWGQVLHFLNSPPLIWTSLPGIFTEVV